MATRTTPLQVLLNALEEPGSCFVLGAGASAPIVPLAAQLSIQVKKRLLSIGSFPALPTPRDVISDRILGAPQTSRFPLDDTFAIQEELAARHFSPAAVHAATVALLRPEMPLYAPPQYQVFGLSRHSHSFINFNNDGLADQYCSQHTVVNLHGTSLSADVRSRLNWESHIDTLQQFHELQGIEIPKLLLPQREPMEIAISKEYRIARNLLQAARKIIIVGYSFGEMDDWIAYNMITSAIRNRHLVTVVVKPDADELALRISEDSGRSTTMALPVYWDKLTMAILASVEKPKYKTCTHVRLCARCVDYLYNGVLDNSQVRWAHRAHRGFSF
jgi:hypothetical protein